jgi:hypothetical protein
MTNHKIIAIIVAGTLLASFMGTIGIMTTQIAEAQQNSSQNHHSRLVWLTTRSFSAQADIANAELQGSQSDFERKDMLVIHLGAGVTLTQAMIDAAKSVTKITPARVAVEFFSLADMQANVAKVKSAGFGAVAYDLEPVASPQAEVDDPVAAFQQAKSIAATKNLALFAAPSRGITEDFGAQIAPLVVRYHIQSQALQNADATCSQMTTFVSDTVDELEAANSNLESRITFQVALTDTRKWSGDPDVFTTAKRCIDSVMASSGASDADGASIFWNAASFDNGALQQLLDHYESTYSSN